MNSILNAVEVCKVIYSALEPMGFYPALTGGCLYKEGDRKDVDIVIYRKRKCNQGFELHDIDQYLKLVGFSDFSHFGFVSKCKFGDISVDLFNPETTGDEEYEDGDDAKAEVTLACFMSQQPRQKTPSFNDGQIEEVRSVNYQDYSGDPCCIPNHYMVILSVAGNPFADHLYFADTEDGKKQAYSVKAGDDYQGWLL